MDVIRRPRVGDHYRLRGTQIVAEVKAVSGGWIAVEIESEDLSMHWRDKAGDFDHRWVRVELARKGA